VTDLRDIPGIKVDKHSTGGVGDKVSLVLAPLVAALGVKVPMISGRGLGHTGGTLDKLESIPGFDVRLPMARFKACVRDVGCSLIGQTDRLAPADRKLYALRDVTGTVENASLIAASILSKKFASGIDALVMDIKVGNGAFMKNRTEAEHLAHTILAIGREVGKPIVCLLTDMNQPMGQAAGNALEVVESIAALRGDGPDDLMMVTYELGYWMLRLAGIEQDRERAIQKQKQAIHDGRALAKFAEVIAAHGGDARVCEDLRLLPQSAQRVSVLAPQAGFVQAIDTEAIGMAALILGAGRRTAEQRIDPAVGLLVRKRLGERVVAGEELVELHVNDTTHLAEAQQRVLQAYQIGDTLITPPPLLIKTIS
jgi:pyrimidine-nucleoside phosphorylase